MLVPVYLTQTRLLKSEFNKLCSPFSHFRRLVPNYTLHKGNTYHNLLKAWQRWVVIFKLLTKMGAMVCSHGMMYKAVSQTVLLYGSESWVVTVSMLKVMEVFHHRAARRIAVMMAWREEGG